MNSNLTLARNLVYLAIFVALFGSGWYSGSAHIEHKWQMEKQSQNVAYLKRKVVQADISEKVVVKYVDRVKVIKDNSRTIIQRVPEYVTKDDDNQCVIPDGFRVHWNAANTGVLPEPTRTPDATTNAIRISDVATQHATEAEICRQNTTQLIALQEWIKEQVKNDHPP